MSLLSDLFRAEERSTAIGIFYLSVAIGISISFLAGGALATAFGWRVVFFIAGVPGIVVAALILLTLVEPRRRRSEQLQVDDDEQPPTLAAAAAYALGSPRLLHLVAAITLTSLTVPATWVWLSSFMIRLHHLPMREVGAIGAAAAVAQGAGSMVIGKIADHHSKAGFRRLGLVAAISTCVSGFLGFFFAFSQSAFLAIVFLFLLSFSLGACLGPSYSILLASTPSRMRGIASAALQVSINLIGVGLGPLFVGAISDIIGGTESLRPALALILSLNFWSSMHYMFVFRAMAGAGTPAA
jgi:MFS family permease